MNERYIAYAIPVFLLAMGLELLGLRRRKIRGYRFPDAIANLGSGIGQQVLDPFLRGLTVVVYGFVWERLAPVQLDARSPWVWALAIVGVDFFYYWFHRASHRVNFLWAVHAVHHQSDEYNLSVALRQPWLEKLVDVPFYLPLALVGVPPEVFVAAFTLNLLYQFWIHTRTVRRLGPLEAVLSTPSHHRVHHGIEPRYIDRNYGGILIVWDRLFGTFCAEDREPRFGTVKPFTRWDPVWANLEPWVSLAAASRKTARLRDKALVWIMPPEWRPDDLGGPVIVPEPGDDRARGPEATPAILAYAAAQLAVFTAGLSMFLFHQREVGFRGASIALGLTLWTLTSWGALLEGRRLARGLELARLVVTATVAAPWIAELWAPGGVALGVFLAASVPWAFWVTAPARGAAHRNANHPNAERALTR